MSFLTTYKGLNAYSSMCPEHQKFLDHQIENYADKLNKGWPINFTAFTLHDFDHHCTDLYRILSNIILREEGIKSLTQEELFLLNLAVLFHDISMSEGGYSTQHGPTPRMREIHAIQSAQWIRHQWETVADFKKYENVELTPEHIEVLCAICATHSAPQTTDEQASEYIKYKNELRIHPIITCTCIGGVRQYALAGLLQLADVLDVYSGRLGDMRELNAMSAYLNVSSAIHHPDQEQLLFESITHWDRLFYIHLIKRDSTDTSFVNLVLNIGHIENKIKADKLDEGHVDEIIDTLSNIKDNIQKTISALWSEIFHQDNCHADRLITIHSVKYEKTSSKGNPVLQHILIKVDALSEEEKAKTLRQPEDEINETSVEQSDDNPITDNEPTVLDVSLSNKIREHVKNNALFSYGDYKLNEKYCTRSWLSTTKMLRDKKISRKIVAVFYKHIMEHFSEEDFELIGLDVVGSTIAAKLGFYMQRPMSYVIPAHLHGFSVPQERDVPQIVSKKIIIITDCIITCETLRYTLENRNWSENTLAIYSIFYRPSIKDDDDRVVFPIEVKNIFTLNKDYPAEIIPVEKCPYGDPKKNCIASNKPV